MYSLYFIPYSRPLFIYFVRFGNYGYLVPPSGRVDDLSYFEYLSKFYFLSIEFHCTFSISWKDEIANFYAFNIIIFSSTVQLIKTDNDIL